MQLKTNEEIEVTVKAGRNKLAWLYRSEESNWTILRTDRGVCKGVVPFEPRVNDQLRMDGYWKVSAFNGDNEFIFSVATRTIQTNSRALLHYAVSITKGLGPAAEDAIWDKYKKTWERQKVLDIPGKTKDLDFHWGDTLQRLQRTRSETSTIAFLIEKTCSLNMAIAAWGRWEEQTLAMVEDNPFILADLPRYGFTAVDQGIRQAYGIDDYDDRRIEAAILYVMEELSLTSGTAISGTAIKKRMGEIASNAVELIDAYLKTLCEKEKIVNMNKAFFALAFDYENETAIFKRMN